MSTERIILNIIVGVGSFGAGLLVAFGIAATLDSPSEREDRLQQHVQELQASLTKEATAREQLSRETREAIAALEKQKQAILSRRSGLGLSRKEIAYAIPHFDFSAENTTNGVTTVDGTSTAGVRMILKGPSENITSIQVFGSLTEPELTRATSLVLGILLEKVSPNWAPSERLELFARAAMVSEYELNVFAVQNDIRISILPMDLNGVQAHIVSFVRNGENE